MASSGFSGSTPEFRLGPKQNPCQNLGQDITKVKLVFIVHSQRRNHCKTGLVTFCLETSPKDLWNLKRPPTSVETNITNTFLDSSPHMLAHTASRPREHITVAAKGRVRASGFLTNVRPAESVEGPEPSSRMHKSSGSVV